MSLRLRLFLGLSGLVAALVLAQWWWVYGLTRDLSTEVDAIATEVGRSVVAHLTLRECGEGEECPPAGGPQDHLVRYLDEKSSTSDDDVVVLHPQPGQVMEWDVEKAGTSSHQVWTAATVDVGEGNVGEEAPGKEPLLVATGTLDEGEGAEGAAGVSETPRRVKVVVAPNPKAEAQAFFFQFPRVEERFLSLGGEGERIRIPSEGFNEKLERFREQLLFGSMGLFGLGLLFSALVAQRVSAPLRKLALAARQVGEGELGTQVASAGSGEVGQAIAAFNQMSSELRLFDERNRELRARQHLGEIGEIARGLAHTLRNPLNALGLSVEELSAQAPAAAGALAESARRQIRRIDRSIRSFLVLASQGGAGVSEVALGELAEDVALEALQDGRGRVRLDVDEAEGTPRLLAVEPELRAVVQALVVNAVEASGEGSTVTVRVRGTGEAGRLRMEVTDQGPGLPPAVRERLFTPHLTTKANGSGMGLFLAHRIATTRYGGSLNLEEGEDGRGVRAVLELAPRNEDLKDV